MAETRVSITIKVHLHIACILFAKRAATKKLDVQAEQTNRVCRPNTANHCSIQHKKLELNKNKTLIMYKMLPFSSLNMFIKDITFLMFR